jgi:hypothetical protein
MAMIHPSRSFPVDSMGAPLGRDSYYMSPQSEHYTDKHHHDSRSVAVRSEKAAAMPDVWGRRRAV